MHQRQSGIIIVAYYKSKDSHHNDVISMIRISVRGGGILSTIQCLTFRLSQRLMPES